MPRHRRPRKASLRTCASSQAQEPPSPRVCHRWSACRGGGVGVDPDTATWRRNLDSATVRSWMGRIELVIQQVTVPRMDEI